MRLSAPTFRHGTGSLDERPMAVSQDELMHLFMAHRAMLAGYVSFLVGDPHLAEDVLQETAVVLLLKGADLDRPEGFAPWARTIARFQALQAKRRRYGAASLDDRLLDTLEAAWSADDTNQTGDVIALRVCLEGLPPRSREMLELRFRGGLSGRPLADRLGKPLNTVYVTLSRLYRALAACIKSRGHE